MLLKIKHIFKYQKFILNSTNEHGVHSPFVYNLVTLCLRRKKNTKLDFKKIQTGFPNTFKIKHINILNCIISYLNINTFTFLCKKTHTFDLLPNLKNKQQSIDQPELIYIDQQHCNLNHTLTLINDLKPNAVVIIENPYSNKKVWEELQSKLETQIVVDTFYFGLIFNRKQQVKENFKIRI